MSERQRKKKIFLENYQVYKDKIYTYFLYRVNFNKDIAEDLTSEVFLKAFKHFDNFEETRSFQSWIYAISHNHLLNYYRTCNRETNLASASNLAINFEKQLKANLELENIIKIIYELDDYYREALLLKFVNGLDNREIAQLLNKDEGAVRTQISRALDELRRKIIV